MFSIKYNKLGLLPRDEGRLKSYESCVDARAWSHDIGTRNRYLRDWIRADMPVCVIPINSVSTTLRMMSWRRHGKVAPICNSDCKSKAIIDTINNSCNAIRKCLRENDQFTKYFAEEEYVTAHWPCDKCLDALKSIKLFWKIILDKIFKIKFCKDGDVDISLLEKQNIKDIADVWEKDLIEQAVFVKNLTPFLNDQNTSPTRFSNESIHKSRTDLNQKSYKDNSTNTGLMIYNTKINRKRPHSLCKNISKCTSVRIETVDAYCVTCDIDNEEVMLYRNNLENLQQQYNLQNDELTQLRNENILLKCELRDIRNNVVPTYTPVLLSDCNAVSIPTPYETYCDKEQSDTIRDIESEMVITLKNCKNKNYRHVSMLQVLHKTNCISNHIINSNCGKNNEDPIEVLTKVHDTFGAIVKRELTIASKKKENSTVFNGTLPRMKKENYYRNCSTKSSNSTISDSIFVSTTEV